MIPLFSQKHAKEDMLAFILLEKTEIMLLTYEKNGRVMILFHSGGKILISSINKNLVYELAHLQPVSGRSWVRLLKLWGSEKYFSEYFDLRTFLHYLHFIQVINPFIINHNNYSFLKCNWCINCCILL